MISIKLARQGLVSIEQALKIMLNKSKIKHSLSQQPNDVAEKL